MFIKSDLYQALDNNKLVKMLVINRLVKTQKKIKPYERYTSIEAGA